MHLCAQAGLRHWIRFIEITHGGENVDSVVFPPDLHDVLAWSNTFRSVTACNVKVLAARASPVVGALAHFRIILATFVGPAMPWALRPLLWGTVPSSEL